MIEPHKGVALTGMALLLILALQAAQGRVDDYEKRFAGESNPVRKAKIMQKLGDSQFDLLRQQVDAGDLDPALQTLTSYRDECVTAHQSLKSTGVDAEQKPSGFKELEFSLRENLGRLHEILSGIPKNEQKRFLELRTSLDELDRQLISELFPRQSKSAAKSNP
jgi:hypothetical protein